MFPISSRLLLVFGTNAALHIAPLTNTVGIYFEKVADTKISNDKWSLVVYKDISMIKAAVQHNNEVLDKMKAKHTAAPDNEFKHQTSHVKTHIQLLRISQNRISNKIKSIEYENPQNK